MERRDHLGPKQAFCETIALFLVISGLLYEGLSPFSFVLPNSARWLEMGDGIELRGRALAFTPPWIDPSSFDPASGVSLEVWLRADARDTNGIVDALTLYDGTLPPLLSVGQARSTLHVRGRSPGSIGGTASWGIRKGGGFSVDMSQMIVVTSSRRNGARLYLNGRDAGHSEDVSIDRITPGHQAQIILGTAADGKGQWSGEIYRIVLYDRALSTAEILELWSDAQISDTREVKSKDDWIALYTLGREGEVGVSHSALKRSGDLRIPPTFIPVRRSEFLNVAPSINAISVKDVWRNLLGFIPFGFFLLLVARRTSTAEVGSLILISIMAGIASSLLIELAQAYIPSRHSSFLDLGLNSFGTLLGTGAACLLLQYEKRNAA